MSCAARSYHHHRRARKLNLPSLFVRSPGPVLSLLEAGNPSHSGNAIKSLSDEDTEVP